ncbi:hypothetical protein HAX54_030100 [Datura stramonium]|uniref:Uncharacterized protein n=1 Tax=Datura stramonium TaxID=4076 RepID=A0ABS8V969_DATST|nr:hypothetical protein [Datura stramonium]
MEERKIQAMMDNVKPWVKSEIEAAAQALHARLDILKPTTAVEKGKKRVAKDVREESPKKRRKKERKERKRARAESMQTHETHISELHERAKGADSFTIAQPKLASGYYPSGEPHSAPIVTEAIEATMITGGTTPPIDIPLSAPATASATITEEVPPSQDDRNA